MQREQYCAARTEAPIFEAAAALASTFQIQTIPTLVVLRDGVMLAAQPGAIPAGALDKLIGTVRALDMHAPA